MPIPLGILAAAGFRPTAGGSYELIETITVGSGGAASVTFSNLNTYSTTYQHLQIRFTAVAPDGNGFNQLGVIRFNGDSGTNYSHHALYETDGGVKSGGSANANGIEWWLANRNSIANAFGVGVIDILDPYETKNKTIRMFDGAMQTSIIYQYFVVLRSGLWRNTGNVSSIQLGVTSGLIAQNSRFSIYGLKAS